MDRRTRDAANNLRLDRDGAGVTGGWILAGIGLVATVVGAILVRRNTPSCRFFDVKVQFAASDGRLARWIGGCAPDLAGAKVALRWDYLLLAGYGLLGVGLIVVLASAASALPMWTVAVPLIASAADAAEDILLLTTLEVRQNRFALPVDSSRPLLVTIAATIKSLGILTTIILIIVGTVRARRVNRLPRAPVAGRRGGGVLRESLHLRS
jgi:hypothetical protein